MQKISADETGVKMIFFDIDNTLIDYDASENNAVTELFKEKYDISLNDEQVQYWHAISKKYFDKYLQGELTFQEQVKKRFCEMTDFCGRNTEENENELLFCDYQFLLEKSWALFGDVNDAIKLLKNFRLGIISNGKSKQQKTKLLCTNIDDYFEIQLFSEDIGKAKPCEDIFLEAVRKSGEKINDIIYVGDNVITDIVPCEKIGIKSVLIDRKGESDSCHTTINNLCELEKLVKKWR